MVAVCGCIGTGVGFLASVCRDMMVLDQLLSQFVDPPGGHRTGVQSPKPPCKPRARQEHARSNPGATQEQARSSQEQARSRPRAGQERTRLGIHCKIQGNSSARLQKHCQGATLRLRSLAGPTQNLQS